MGRLSLSVLVIGTATSAVLAAYGWWRHPDISFVSVAAVSSIFAAYGLTGRVGRALFPAQSLAASVGLVSGIIAGLIFCSEISLEYVLLPQDNTTWGIVEFGAVLLVYFAAGLTLAIRGEPLHSSVKAAVLAAMISSILWCVCLLSIYLLFEGTARQAAVLLAEGDFDDFRRSRMSSFRTFEMEDLFGASFFHLLLGPVIAAMLASVAWLGAKALKLARRV